MPEDTQIQEPLTTPDLPGLDLDDFDDPEAALVQAELEAAIKRLEEEFGADQVTNLMLLVEIDDEFAPFLAEAMPAITAACETARGKARFYVHEEPITRELYLLRSPLPREWKTAWIDMWAGQPGAYDAHIDSLLSTCMCYPAFDQTDWDYEGERDGVPLLRAPQFMTKSRLADTFFRYEAPRQGGRTVDFTADELERTQKVITRKIGPSL